MRTRVFRCGILSALAFLAAGTAQASLNDALSHVPADYSSFTPPPSGQTYTDATFSTEVRRLSNATSTSNAADGGNLTWIVGEYSSMSAFNQDASLLLLQHDSYFALYDGQGRYLRDLPFEVHAGSQPRWSRQSPGVLYFINGNALKRYDAVSETTAVVRAFGEYGSISGNGESDICFDGDHLVLAGDSRHIFVYQISTDAKGPVLDASAHGFDSIYITPDDNVLVSWFQHGAGRYSGIELYNRNMVFQRQVATAGGHMDVTRDLDGSEALVWTNSADPAPICDNGIVKVRLADARQSCLLSLDWSLGVHIGCADRGACIVGTYAPGDPSPSGSWPAYTNELLQVKLDGSPAVRLAHHRSRPRNDYMWQPHASSSRDGSRVLFSSNFNLQTTQGKPTEYTDAYLIATAATAPPPPPAPSPTPTPTPTPPPGGTGELVRIEEDHPSVVYSGTWFDNTYAAHSEGGAKLAADRGSRATVRFNGTGIRWIGHRDEWSGIARVRVDGALVGKVDTYRSPEQSQSRLYQVANLPRGTHTLEIVVMDSKRGASGGTWVWADAFEILP